MTRHSAVALTAAAGLLLGAVTSCASNPARNGGSGSAASGPPIVGYKWLLTSVRTARGQTTVPPSLAATIQFSPAGTFVASDTVNTVSGSYSSTSTGFTVNSAGTTLVGYAGTDPERLDVIAAVGAITGGEGANNDVTVTADSPTSVRMAVSGYTLTFRRAGHAQSFGPASPTPSATRPS
jgi:hypothetical protein